MRAIAAVRGASLCAMRRASPRGAAQGPKDMYSGAYLRLALLACASRGHYAAARRRACCRARVRKARLVGPRAIPLILVQFGAILLFCNTNLKEIVQYLPNFATPNAKMEAENS